MRFAGKYKNVRVKEDGITFDSKAEAKRYKQLKLMQMMGQICDLKVHPRYPIVVNDVKVCTYVGDFEYRDHRGTHVEDVKGVKTSVFKLKAKLMKVVKNVDVECVRIS